MLVAVPSPNGPTPLPIRATLQVVNQQFNGRSSTGILSCALPLAVVEARLRYCAHLLPRLLPPVVVPPPSCPPLAPSWRMIGLIMSALTRLRLLKVRSISTCPSVPSSSECISVCAYVCVRVRCCSCDCGRVSVMVPRTVVQCASPSRPLPRQHILFERPFWLLLRYLFFETLAHHTSMSERRVGWSRLTLIVIVCWDPCAFCR